MKTIDYLALRKDKAKLRWLEHGANWKHHTSFLFWGWYAAYMREARKHMPEPVFDPRGFGPLD